MATQQIVLEVDSKGQAKAVNAAKAVKGSWLDTAAKLSVVWLGVRDVFSKVASAMAKPIEEAGKFVQTRERMKATLDGLGKDAQKVTGEFMKWSDQMALTTGKSQDTIFALQDMALQLTGSEDKVNDMVTAAMAMQQAIGIDAVSGLKNLNKTFAGMTGELGEAIPELRNLTKEQLQHGDAIALLTEKFGPALTAHLQTASGQYERLSNIIFDRYLEAAGMAISDNAVLTAGLAQMGDELAAVAPSTEDLGRMVSDLSIVLIGVGVAGVSAFADIYSAILTAKGVLAEAGIQAIRVKMLFTNAIQRFTDERAFETEFAAATEGLTRMSESAIQAKIDVNEWQKDFEGAALRVADKMNAAAKKITKSSKQVKKDVGENMSKPLAKVSEEVIDLGDQMVISFISPIEEAKKASDLWLKSLEGYEDVLRANDERRAKLAGDQAGAKDDGVIGATITGFLERAGGFFFDKLVEIIKGLFEALKDPENAKRMAAEIVEMIKTVVQSLTTPGTLESLIDAFAEVVEAVLAALTNEQVINRFISGVVQIIEVILNALATPGVLGTLVKGFVRLVFAIIGAVEPHLFDIGIEIIKAIGEGIWEALKGIGERIKEAFGLGEEQSKGGRVLAGIATFGISEGVRAAKNRHGGGPIVAHTGLGLSSTGRAQVPAILEAGEAVVPNANRGSYQGLSTDGRGNVVGRSVNINIYTMDAGGVRDWLRREGAGAFNDFIARGGVDQRGRALGAV